MCCNKDGFPASVAQKCSICWEIKEHLQSFLLTGMCHLTASCLQKYPVITQAPCLQLPGDQGRKEKWAHCTVFLADDISAAWSTNQHQNNMDYQAGKMFMGRFCRVSVDAEILAKLGNKKWKRKGGEKRKKEGSGIKRIYLPEKLRILKLPFS